MKKIFVAGGASYNNVVQLEEFPAASPATYHHCEYNEGIGSTGAGKSLNLAQLGFEINFHTLLGNDEYKQKVLKALDQKNIRVHFDIDPLGTERHINILNSKGQRISIFTNPISDDIQINIKTITPVIENCDLAIINIYNYCKQLLPICKSHGKSIWTDLHDYPPDAWCATNNASNAYYDAFIEYADVVFMSNEKIDDPESVLRHFISLGKEIAVCTLGAEGSMAMNQKGELIHSPACTDVHYRNSNGAGDAYSSGFLLGYLQRNDLETCVKLASIAAGKCVEHYSLCNPTLSPKDLSKFA